MSLRMWLGAKLARRTYVRPHRRTKRGLINKCLSKITFGIIGKSNVKSYTRK